MESYELVGTSEKTRNARDQLQIRYTLLRIPDISRNSLLVSTSREFDSPGKSGSCESQGQEEPLGLGCQHQKASHRYLVLPSAVWELTTSVRLFLRVGGSYGGNSPRLFLLMSSSPPCTSQVSWVTGVGRSVVGWSAVDRSSLRMLWLYLDGSYFRVRALLPFWLLSCRTGRTRPNLLTTQSWNQSTQRTVNTFMLTHDAVRLIKTISVHSFPSVAERTRPLLAGFNMKNLQQVFNTS